MQYFPNPIYIIISDFLQKDFKLLKFLNMKKFNKNILKSNRIIKQNYKVDLYICLHIKYFITILIFHVKKGIIKMNLIFLLGVIRLNYY